MRMLGRRHKMDSKSLQIVVRIVQGGNLRFTSIAGSGIKLADIQRTSEQACNLAADRFRLGSGFHEDFLPPLKIKILDQSLPGQAAASKAMHDEEGIEFGESSASNALAIIE